MIARAACVAWAWSAGLRTHPEAPFDLPVDSLPLGFEAPALIDVLAGYGRLGVEHLLGGLDHVLFVLALVLLAPHARRLVATLTAFTLGHSLTLGASALGVLALPSAWAEIAIALTLLVVALQVLDDDDAGSHGPLLAGAFGLVHGLGFAGVLGELGLPAGARVPALVAFNVGVELGQLAIVLVAWPLQRVLARHAPRARALSRIVLGYAIGALACMWTIARVLGA